MLNRSQANTTIKDVLNRVKGYTIAILDMNIIKSFEGDSFYKGDLDGKNIYLADNLTPDEELFYVLHMVGHNIQWNIDPKLRELGAILHVNPDDELLKKLLLYEWEANCYGLGLLHKCGMHHLDYWLQSQYMVDTCHLVHFYKTREKLKTVESCDIWKYTKPLMSYSIPDIECKQFKKTRNGLVIDFKQ